MLFSAKFKQEWFDFYITACWDIERSELQQASEAVVWEKKCFILDKTCCPPYIALLWPHRVFPQGFYIGSLLLTCKYERLFPRLLLTPPSKIFSGCFAEAIETWWWDQIQLPLSWEKELLWLQNERDIWDWVDFCLCVRVFVIFTAESAMVDTAGHRWWAASRVKVSLFSKENMRVWCHPGKLKSCLSVSTHLLNKMDFVRLRTLLLIWLMTDKSTPWW